MGVVQIGFGLPRSIMKGVVFPSNQVASAGDWMLTVREDALNFVFLSTLGSENGIWIRRSVSLSEAVWTRVEFFKILDIDSGMDTNINRKV